MNKKITAAFLAATLTITALAGCNDVSENTSSNNNDNSTSNSTTSNSLEKTSFNLGHLNSTAHLLGFVAKEEGYFEEEGLDVTLTLFSSVYRFCTVNHFSEQGT